MKLILYGQRLELIPEGPVDDMILSQILQKSTTYVVVNVRGVNTNKEDKLFYIDTGDKIILSRNQLHVVRYILEESNIKYTIEDVEPKYQFKDIDVKVLNGYTFRDDLQKEYNKFLLVPRKSYLCTLQTGKGKTGSTILSLAFRKNVRRYCILIPPRFHKIWIDAFQKFTNITEEKVLVVSGRDSLYALQDISDDVKVVILSPPTIREYLKSYVCGEDVPFKPEDILNYVGCDHLIVDETHEDFAGNYINILALNPYSYIALTATYSSSQDPRKIRLHKEYFIPVENRLPEAERDKYVNIVFCQFKFNLDKDLKFLNPFKKWYSHNLLEESILKLSRRYVNFFNMLIYFMQHYYDGKPNHRMLVLFSRVDMCKQFKQYLVKNEVFPGKSIATLVQGDPKTNIENDIIISTGKSGGTGIDIENVQVTFNTISTKSEYSGIQFSGRNRKMEGVEQYYLSLWAVNIPAQANYKRQNARLYKEIGKQISNNFYPNGNI